MTDPFAGLFDETKKTQTKKIANDPFANIFNELDIAQAHQPVSQPQRLLFLVMLC